MGWTKRTFNDQFAEVLARYRGKEFLISGEARLTYGDVEAEVVRFAKLLLALGVRHGDRVAAWLSNEPEFVVAWLAAARIGAILVAMNTRFKTIEAGSTLRLSQASTLIFKEEFAGVDFLAMVREMCPEFDAADRSAGQGSDFPYLRNFIHVSRQEHPGMVSFYDAEAGAGVSDEELAAATAAVRPDDPVLIIFTSGTTGRPKGAVHSHNAILKNEYRITRWQRVGSEDRRLDYLPPYHIAGSCTEIIGTMMTGGTLVLMATFEPTKALSLVERERCTMLDGIPTHFIMMMEHPDFDRYDLSTLRGGWVGGAPVTREVAMGIIEKMGMREVVVVYGMTETISVTCFTRVGESVELICSSDGLPISTADEEVFGEPPGFEVSIRTPEGVAAPGSEAEICVRGDIVMAGYYNMPEETRAVIDRDGWFHTGDVGRFLPSGHLRVTGRLKDMYIVGGTNAYPAEIEAFYSQHPKVKLVQIVGVLDHRLGEVGLAFIELKAGQTGTEEEFIAYAKGRIADYKVPRFVRFVHESDWPLTASGKIQKFVLRQRGAEALKAGS